MNNFNIHTQPQMLSDLVSGLGVYSKDIEINRICDDTRKLQAGDTFLCLPRVQDVAAMVQQAMDKQASSIIFVGQPHDKLETVCACLPDMNAAGLMLRRWFNTESTAVTCVGITGTDGKTSTAWMLREAMAKHLGSAWSVGTLGWKASADETLDLGNTTPSLMVLHQILAKAHQEGVAALILEVSSHGIAQERIAGIPFAAAIWTTMGHDHLEDHGGFEQYLHLKTSFVQSVAKSSGVVVANTDYSDINQALSDVSGRIFWYGKDKAADMQWHTEQGQLQLRYHHQDVVLNHVPSADFHHENLAAVALLMIALFDLNIDQIKSFEDMISTPQGRLEPVGNSSVFIDYAHTAEGLKRCLESARQLTQGQLLLVFGCGGNRDKAKRPAMGEVAAAYADACWLTSDNPRDEQQQDIAQDVLSGMGDKAESTHVIEDRKQAIEQAVAALCADDILVIAGKGHESYMETQGQRLPWSDKEAAQHALQAREVQQCA